LTSPEAGLLAPAAKGMTLWRLRPAAGGTVVRAGGGVALAVRCGGPPKVNGIAGSPAGWAAGLAGLRGRGWIGVVSPTSRAALSSGRPEVSIAGVGGGVVARGGGVARTVRGGGATGVSAGGESVSGVAATRGRRGAAACLTGMCRWTGAQRRSPGCSKGPTWRPYLPPG